MKKYIFTVNGIFGTGIYTIEANNKKEAIENAKKKYAGYGVNISSFKLVNKKATKLLQRL